jgi:hypothetical protein
MNGNFRAKAVTALALAVSATVSCGPSSNSGEEANVIRATERERVRVLVEANIEVATQLHADDFQLISPAGVLLTKEQYLGNVASGATDYLVWEPGPIEVRAYGDAAVIRYQSKLQVVLREVPRVCRRAVSVN